MAKLVEPAVFFVGYTNIDVEEISEYLANTGQLEFMEELERTIENEEAHPAEALCSMFAKLCYKSLVAGKNKNISRTRGIKDNLIGCFNHAHGSIFEHVQLNFIVTKCSRVFTHELVRHRVGTAFSQTSGRYVRGDELDIVFDPILEPVRYDIMDIISDLEHAYKELVEKMGLEDMKDFGRKKKITSALRRILPNGQANEIAFSCNLRTLRHLVMLRTSRHAEWEIRHVFNQIYNLVAEKFPMIFYGAKVEKVDGLLEVTGMKMQPYEQGLEG